MNIYRGRNQTEFYLASILYDAIEDNDIGAVIHLLRDKHADPNLVLPARGISPFHLAVGTGGSATFAHRATTAILQYGAGDPNNRTDEGLTPLHIAAAWGRLDTVQLLLTQGADADLTDNCYRTAVDYARTEEWTEVVDVIEEHLRAEVSAIWARLDGTATTGEKLEIVLDRILVKTGETVGEYAIDTDVTPALSNTSISVNLNLLPKSNPKELVSDWCTLHHQRLSDDCDDCDDCDDMSYSVVINNPYEITNDDLVHTTSNNSSFNNNLNENIAAAAATTTTSLNKSCFKVPRSDIITSVAKQQSKMSKLSKICNKCSDISRESGIMTLPEDSLDNIESFLKSSNVVTENSDLVVIASDLLTQGKDTSSDYYTCTETTASSSLVRNPLEENIFDVLVSESESLNENNANNLTNGDRSNSNRSNGNHGTSDRSNSDRSNGNHGYGDRSNGGLVSLLSSESMTTQDCHNMATFFSAADDSDATSGTDESFVSVISEVYKYMDKDEGVVLYERRLLCSSGGAAATPQSNLNETEVVTISSCKSSTISKLSSLPASFDYDTDSLRTELKLQGFEPGPITNTTKRVYLRKLYSLKKHPVSFVITENRKAYSREIERTLRQPDWWSTTDLAQYKHLEETVAGQFRTPDPNRRWREGVSKSSFTYLLLDPRITRNLPGRAERLTTADLWPIFLQSIFYIGKGKRSRPYQHLYDAVNLWKKANSTNLNANLNGYSENLNKFDGEKSIDDMVEVRKEDCQQRLVNECVESESFGEVETERVDKLSSCQNVLGKQHTGFGIARNDRFEVGSGFNGGLSTINEESSRNLQNNTEILVNSARSNKIKMSDSKSQVDKSSCQRLVGKTHIGFNIPSNNDRRKDDNGTVNQQSSRNLQNKTKTNSHNSIITPKTTKLSSITSNPQITPTTGGAIIKSAKLQRIVDIWSSGCGVVCLHVFQNVIPVEAYCREAAMIAALTKDNLTNSKVGDFYGVAATWPANDKRQLGVYLLYKAMMILLSEGERQLSPTDID